MHLSLQFSPTCQYLLVGELVTLDLKVEDYSSLNGEQLQATIDSIEITEETDEGKESGDSSRSTVSTSTRRLQRMKSVDSFNLKSSSSLSSTASSAAGSSFSSIPPLFTSEVVTWSSNAAAAESFQLIPLTTLITFDALNSSSFLKGKVTISVSLNKIEKIAIPESRTFDDDEAEGLDGLIPFASLASLEKIKKIGEVDVEMPLYRPFEVTLRPVVIEKETRRVLIQLFFNYLQDFSCSQGSLNEIEIRGFQTFLNDELQTQNPSIEDDLPFSMSPDHQFGRVIEYQDENENRGGNEENSIRLSLQIEAMTVITHRPLFLTFESSLELSKIFLNNQPSRQQSDRQISMVLLEDQVLEAYKPFNIQVALINHSSRIKSFEIFYPSYFDRINGATCNNANNTDGSANNIIKDWFIRNSFPDPVVTLNGNSLKFINVPARGGCHQEIWRFVAMRPGKLDIDGFMIKELSEQSEEENTVLTLSPLEHEFSLWFHEPQQQ